MSLNIDYLILEEKLDAAIARMGLVIDCPPPYSNGAASVVVTPAEPGKGVGFVCAMVPEVVASLLSVSSSIPLAASSCGESAKSLARACLQQKRLGESVAQATSVRPFKQSPNLDLTGLHLVKRGALVSWGGLRFRVSRIEGGRAYYGDSFSNSVACGLVQVVH